MLDTFIFYALYKVGEIWTKSEYRDLLYFTNQSNITYILLNFLLKIDLFAPMIFHGNK